MTYGDIHSGMLCRMDLMAVRRQLFVVRKEKGFTQDEVAEDADVSQATVSRLESLDTDMAEIEFETIRKLVEKGLGVRLSDFFLSIEEGQTNTDRQRTEPSGITAGAKSDSHAGVDRSLSAADSPLAPTLKRVAESLIDAGSILYGAVHPEGSTARPPQSVRQVVKATRTRKKRRARSG